MESQFYPETKCVTYGKLPNFPKLCLSSAKEDRVLMNIKLETMCKAFALQSLAEFRIDKQ